MDRNVAQINKCKNTPPSNGGDRTCKKIETVPVADKLHGILKSLQTDCKSGLPDRGDVNGKTSKPTAKSILADVARIVSEDRKVQTVNRCSSIGNVRESCVTKLPREKRQMKRPPPKPACNALCRDKCRITFEERQRLRQRYTFRLKPQHSTKEEEKVAKEEEDTRKTASRLKYYYLPNNRSLDEPTRRDPNPNPPRAKGVTFTTERAFVPTYMQPRPAAKLSTSPVKLRSRLSKASIKTKRRRAKKAIVCVRSSSPELAKNCLSPPTEIARWISDASSVHAKPYYDAWVSTTLAAISQRSQNDELYQQKKEIVQRLTRDYDDAGGKSHSLLTNSRCQLDEARDNWDFSFDMPTVDETVVGRIRVKR